jgi:putative nucleotidyltransferase with HDIG domain
MENEPQIPTLSCAGGGALRNTAATNASDSSLCRAASSRARPYVLSVLLAGCVVLASSIAELWVGHPPIEWWALVALTLISGSAVLKIPSASASFSISDVFTLTSAVVFGPAAGTMLVAIDSLAISARLVRTGLPVERILFNAAAPPVAMWVSAHAFSYASGFQPLFAQPVGLEFVGPWLLLFAGLYFVLNTFAIAVAIALHERANPFAIWRAYFQNLWLAFLGGALGAGFVVFALQRGSYAVVVFSAPLLLALILHFAYRNSTGRLADQLHHLAEVNRLHLSTIEALAHAIDAKDAVTHGHIRRVQSLAVALAARVGVQDEQQVRAIEAAALLHDIGKLAVPEHILNKPSKLTPAEFERMKSHARVGAEILSEVDFPYPVVPIVRHHHESWDGTGYPDGLSGADIPIGARILSVVDCFDALTSDRPYRRALSAREAFAIIEARSATMYDPAIVEAFREVCTSTQVAGTDAVNEAAAAAAMSAAVRTESGRSTPDDIDELQLALGLGAALSRISEQEHPWRELSDALRRLPGVDTVAIFIVDEPQHRLVVARTSGTHARRLEGLSMAVGDRISGWVAATGQPMVNAEAGLDLFDVSALALRAAIAVPCSTPAGAKVVLTLYSATPDAFSSLHHRLLAAAASFVQSIGSQHARIECVSTGTPQVRWRQRTRRSGLPQRSAVNCETRP